jgi:hypothetical protein
MSERHSVEIAILLHLTGNRKVPTRSMHRVQTDSLHLLNVIDKVKRHRNAHDTFNMPSDSPADPFQ